jgi:hypothetical protein
MRAYYMIALVLLCIKTGIFAQDTTLTADYFYATGDYISDSLTGEPVFLIAKDRGADYIHARDILDPRTMKHSEEGSNAWAVQYKEHAYVNLRYSQNAYAPNMLVMLDIKGRFCLAVMEPEFQKILDKADRDSSVKIGGNKHAYDGSVGGLFEDGQGHQRQIFIVDTKDLSIVIPYKAKNAPIDLLTKSTLKWLVGKENFKGSLSDYKVEEIISIVEDLNRRQKPEE